MNKTIISLVNKRKCDDVVKRRVMTLQNSRQYRIMELMYNNLDEKYSVMDLMEKLHIPEEQISALRVSLSTCGQFVGSSTKGDNYKEWTLSATAVECIKRYGLIFFIMSIYFNKIN